MISLAVWGMSLRCETSPLFQWESWMQTWLYGRCRSNLIARLTAGMCAVKKNKSFIFDMLGVSQDWMDRLQGGFSLPFPLLRHTNLSADRGRRIQRVQCVRAEEQDMLRAKRKNTPVALWTSTGIKCDSNFGLLSKLYMQYITFRPYIFSLHTGCKAARIQKTWIMKILKKHRLISKCVNVVYYGLRVQYTLKQMLTAVLPCVFHFLGNSWVILLPKKG